MAEKSNVALPVNEKLFMRVVQAADIAHSLKKFGQDGKLELTREEQEKFSQAKRDLLRTVNKLVMDFKNTPHYPRALERRNRQQNFRKD